MKKLLMVIPLAFLLCFTFGCQQPVEEVAEQPVVDVEAEKVRVKSTLDDWVQSFETENMELFSKVMSHDPDMVVMGTDTAEYFIGWEAFKESQQRWFGIADSMDFSVRNQAIKVHNSGEVAWASQLLDAKVVSQGEEFAYEGVRMTLVLEKRNDNWIIVQLHSSVPATTVEY